MERHLKDIKLPIVCIILLCIVGCGSSTTVVGNPTIVRPSVTVPVNPGNPTHQYTAISAGYRHACELDLAGLAYCWGDNTDGDLGDGTMNPSARPVAVTGGHVFSAISAGLDHTCAIGGGSSTDRGKVFCWGSNAQGQLGIGSTVAYETQPMQVADSSAFTSVSAGDQATCALTDQHYGRCWGYNQPTGALGLGIASPSPIYRPMPVLGIYTQTFSSLAVSVSTSASDPSHMCGLSHFQQLQYQQIFCWGNNASGELSIQPVGHVVPYPYPFGGSGTGTFGPLPTGTVFLAVSVGGKYSCGIPAPGLPSPKGVYCWGDNSLGQLGFTGSGGPFPVYVKGSAALQSISTGYDSACAKDASQTGPNTYCWGNNSHGQLGLGFTTSGNTGYGYAPTAAVADHHFTVLSVGVDYACGIDSGAAYSSYCWGANNTGQLGDGSMNDSSTPARVLFP